MNSLTFLAIRHKGEHDHSNWPILSCQLPAALTSTHTGTAQEPLAKKFSLHRVFCWAERGCHGQLAVLHTYRAPMVHEG